MLKGHEYVLYRVPERIYYTKRLFFTHISVLYLLKNQEGWVSPTECASVSAINLRHNLANYRKVRCPPVSPNPRVSPKLRNVIFSGYEEYETQSLSFLNFCILALGSGQRFCIGSDVQNTPKKYFENTK